MDPYAGNIGFQMSYGNAAHTWHPYYGRIPHGAISAGRDAYGDAYIGRIIIDGSSYVGTLRNNVMELKICRGGVENYTQSIEILCSNIDITQFQWVPNGTQGVGSTNLVGVIEDQGHVEIVRTIKDDVILIGTRAGDYAPYVVEHNTECNPVAFDRLYGRVMQ